MDIEIKGWALLRSNFFTWIFFLINKFLYQILANATVPLFKYAALEEPDGDMLICV